MKIKSVSNNSSKQVYVGTKSGVYQYEKYCIYNKYSLSLKGFRFRRCNFVKVYTSLRGIHCIKNQAVEFL